MPNNQQIEEFYNAFGKKQDNQFYENLPISTLVVHSEFEKARNIYEFGCGTGKFAKLLFDNYLNSECQYSGIDISSTMTELCQDRLKSYSTRAKCIKGNLLEDKNTITHNVDRFITTYVLDLLSDDNTNKLLDIAYNMLQPGGYLCVAGLTYGTSMTSRMVEKTWQILYKLKPMLVGGCRPVCISEKLSMHKWSIRYLHTVVSYGVPSEVLVAKKIA